MINQILNYENHYLQAFNIFHYYTIPDFNLTTLSGHIGSPISAPFTVSLRLGAPRACRKSNFQLFCREEEVCISLFLNLRITQRLFFVAIGY